MSGRGTGAQVSGSCTPRMASKESTPTQGGGQKYLGPDSWSAWWGTQTGPLARLSEEDLGVGLRG